MILNDIQNNFFIGLHKTVSKFIWKNKRPKIRLEKLQLPVVNGDLAVPNFQYYFWLIKVKNVSEWVAQDPKSIWLDFEMQGCKSLSSAPFFNTLKQKNRH